MVSTRTFIGLCTAALLPIAGTAAAGDLVYNPVIPAFGGFPDYYGYLLGTAQIQNQYLPPSDSGGGGGAPDINFPPIVIDLGGIGGSAAEPQQAPIINGVTNTASN